MDLWFRLLMGHIMGDYLFQTRALAYNKKKRTRAGFWASVVHALIYTACVIGWLLPECIAAPWLIPAVFASHWPIDRYPVATEWMRALGRRGPCDATVPGEDAVSAVVYCVIDNWMHLTLMAVALALATGTQ